jgi:hypothetical protein
MLPADSSTAAIICISRTVSSFTGSILGMKKAAPEGAAPYFKTK